ncbi:MAG: outer membrane protein assembly factor BamE [Desulfuromonadales bacterium]|jgi:outer membrane protein assembly factor BamE (lipoprotein component of BamABCDE complex)
MVKVRMISAGVLLVLLSLPVISCMPSVGRPFPVQQVRQIEIGVTTQAEVRQMFGTPWRTGIDDGDRTWTYGEYSMQKTRDLKIRFDDKDVVKSYSFSSSYPEDADL